MMIYQGKTLRDSGSSCSLCLLRRRVAFSLSCTHNDRYNFISWDAAADVEVRDWSLEVLFHLCSYRDLHGKLFEAVPGLMRSLLLIVDTKTGRPETPEMVGKMICQLASEGRGQRELELLKPVLIHSAFKSEAAAQLLWNLYFAPEPLETELGEAGADDGMD